MVKIVAGAEIRPGECGEDDVTSENLDQMADTLEQRPPTDADRRELVVMLRWLARLVREIDSAAEPDTSAPSGRAPMQSDDPHRDAPGAGFSP